MFLGHSIFENFFTSIIAVCHVFLQLLSTINSTFFTTFKAKNNRTYIFADTIFWRYNDELQALDEGYPKTMIRWPGIPDNIDAAATLPNGLFYT